MSSLKQLAMRGTIWTIASYGANQILRFGSNLILTRLLFPKLFGLMALVNTFIIGLNLFSDIGIGPSIIQNKRGDDPAFLNTAWTLQVIRGFALWFGSIAIAWPVAKFYEEPQLLWLIPVVGLNAVISGFNSTALATLNRHLSIGKLAIFQLGGQIISVTVMIVWAWFNQSIWALVIGSFVSTMLQMVWSHRLHPGVPNRFAWEQNAIQDLFTFGKWIFISTALTFLASQADRLILAKLISIEMLGVYSIAFALADIPRQIVRALSGTIIFPTLSKLADLPRETFRAKILQKRKYILVAFALGFAVLIGFGDMLILALYDRRYTEASWMMPILALGLWHTLLYGTMGYSLIAVGKPMYNSLGFLLSFLTISIGLPLGFYQMGIVGAVIVIAFYDLPLYGVMVYGLWREGLMSIGQDIKATLLFFVLLTTVLLGRFLLGWGLPINQLLQQ
ncbi:MAG TPA: oligosaccharide flippase family protein [Oculatellaceae cyanobacterium]|jgi:O-antigen/teichoic acid export membrane protein